MRYLGTITGSSGVGSNVATGPSGLGTFTIPKGVKSLFLQPSASGMLFEVGSTGLATDPTRGAFLPYSFAAGAVASVPNSPAGPFRAPGVDGGTVVSVYNTVGGFISVRVYGSDGPG
jgi:hypothetical protein